MQHRPGQLALPVAVHGLDRPVLDQGLQNACQHAGLEVGREQAQGIRQHPKAIPRQADPPTLPVLEVVEGGLQAFLRHDPGQQGGETLHQAGPFIGIKGLLVRGEDPQVGGRGGGRRGRDHPLRLDEPLQIALHLADLLRGPGALGVMVPSQVLDQFPGGQAPPAGTGHRQLGQEGLMPEHDGMVGSLTGIFGRHRVAPLLWTRIVPCCDR